VVVLFPCFLFRRFDLDNLAAGVIAAKFAGVVRQNRLGAFGALSQSFGGEREVRGAPALVRTCSPMTR